MKRNRLVNSRQHPAIFSSAPSYFRIRYIALAIIVAVIAFFLTGFFSNEPTHTVSQSHVIDLPGLPATQQVKTDLPNTNTLALATPVNHTPQDKQITKQATDVSETLIPTNEQNQNEVSAIEAADTSVDTPAFDWQEVVVKSGDNLSLIFDRVGLTARDVYNVTQLDKTLINPLFSLKPGQTIHIATLSLDDSTKSLEALKIILSPIETFFLQKENDEYHAEIVTRELDILQKQVTGEIETSLFGSGLAAGLSDKVVMELAYIFGWDIDFALDLRQGDQFKLIYEEQYLDGEKIGDGDILAAEFTNRGQSFRAIRFTDDEGESDYFSPEGDSMRKTFNRTPVPLSRISSRFNPNRKHPILQTNRPHRGVDYAAKRGTPILATGDGKVSFVGTKGGYGRTVILSHIGKYTTLYAHMSRFKKGLRTGQRIRQGQVIGYIGSSGLATGPHLHYEFRVNGVHRNPLTVKLPKAQPLAKQYRAQFKTLATPYLAQLDAMQSTALAQSE